MGALLAPRKRTVTACLRLTGRADAGNFTIYHQVLNRARWNGRALARTLLGIVVGALVPQGPVIIGVDDTIERRWGARIAARGIYRDPVRSSHAHFVKTSGLRWLSFMVLAPVPWAERIRALPVLTVLAPSDRANAQEGRRHKLLADWARQGMLQICRWLPGRRIIFVGDAGFAVHTLAHALEGRAQTLDPATRWQPITVPVWYGRQTEKHLDITSGTALWYRTGTPPRPIRWVLVRDPDGKRNPQAFFSTDTTLAPAEIIAIFVRRWQVEVTFAEVRAHLGVETQRQWSQKAIARTTPVLMGLYSLVTLWAEDLLKQSPTPYAAIWYRKTAFTFTDASAAVRHRIWIGDINRASPCGPDMQKIPPDRLIRMAQALCFAA